jgi:hypothetical protein
MTSGVYKRTEETLKKMRRTGETSNGWKGGRRKLATGYVYIYSLDHPYRSLMPSGGGYIFEHRLVMERHIGRHLLPTEVVHHINGILDDNRIENLILFSSKSEHTSYHHPKGKPIAMSPFNIIHEQRLKEREELLCQQKK